MATIPVTIEVFVVGLVVGARAVAPPPPPPLLLPELGVLATVVAAGVELFTAVLTREVKSVK